MCDIICPDGQYIDKLNSPLNCLPCNPGCLRCNITECFLCISNYFINLTKIDCVKFCP